MNLPSPNMRQAVEDAMRAAFPDAEARVARFYAMQQYHLGWRDAQLAPSTGDPGKLLRPYLVLLACQAVGGRSASLRRYTGRKDAGRGGRRRRRRRLLRWAAAARGKRKRNQQRCRARTHFYSGIQGS